jgi:LacI family transcriptional regulator
MLRFRPNGLAKDLRSGAVSSGVGLIIADLGNPFFSRLASAAEKELREHALGLFIASTDDDPEREREVVRTMLDRRVRALIVIPSATDHSYLQFEQSLGTPIVFVDRPPHFLDADAVIADNRASAFAATEALIAAGHQRIGVIGDKQIAWTATERLAGVQQALRQHGRPLGDYIAIDAHDTDQARAHTRRMLQLAEPPTALFALNNLILLGILLGLQDHPAPVSLLGYDDSPIAELLSISAVSLDPAEMGRRAAELALARLAGQTGGGEVVSIPTSLVIRSPLDRPALIPTIGSPAGTHTTPLS